MVTVTGSSFSTRAPVADVVLRWNGVDGPELARVQPDKAGNISATFAVPESQPGYYVLTATQKDERGIDTYGTPARASYLVLDANGQNVTPPATAPAATGVTPESGSGGIVALTVGLGVLGLALFGAGFIAFLRQARRAPEAATARQS